MKLLLINGADSDFAAVLRTCDAEITEKTEKEAASEGIDGFDACCVLNCEARSGYAPRLREMLEKKAEEGCRLFLERPSSFGNIYSQPPVCTVRSRLVYVGDEKIPGISFGDLLDDCANLAAEPWYDVPGTTPLFVYREHITAHAHTRLSKDEIMKDSRCGIWKYGENVIMTSFLIKNFNRARFAPRKSWQSLVSRLCIFLTGSAPEAFPAPAVTFGPGRDVDLSDPAVFEEQRKKTVANGIKWLEQFLTEDCLDGIREGLSHNIGPDGKRELLNELRNDCTGESAGAFRAFFRETGDEKYREIADRLENVVFGPLQVKGGRFDGMHRWTASAWAVCYQDDAARALLPVLYRAYFTNETEHLKDVFRSLDYLLKITCKDGCAPMRTDCKDVPDEEAFEKISGEEHGCDSAHYNAYYHAALLLAYLCGGKKEYLETGRKGLETLMTLYPCTKREQSETEEICRLIPGLSLLYMCTGEEKHRNMLYRVTDDLQRFRHPFGGYAEWDTGYTASCSRKSTGECSVLSENGDPVADSLYSSNWLPVGFALAYRATKDKRFCNYWKDIVSFYIKIQAHSEDSLTDGSWCRAFDMDREEAYANPHDVGWAAYSCETGWTAAEIIMGMTPPVAPL